MKTELKRQIIAYNKNIKEQKKKSTDLDLLVSAIANLPAGQLKKVLSDDIVRILAKYGVVME